MALGATREKLSERRITRRAAISATGVRATGAAETARSAHNAVITATTARIFLERLTISQQTRKKLIVRSQTRRSSDPNDTQTDRWCFIGIGDVPHCLDFRVQ
jgi:hypothetical protein